MKKLSLILGMTLLASMAMAQEEAPADNSATSTVEQSQVIPKDAEKKDIDEEITNARMRATTGAKSKYSFRSAFGYSGGSVEKPFDRVRPNYRSSLNTLTSTRLSGSVAFKYRATDRDNISGGIGVSMLTPLHNKIDEAGERTTFSDPYVSYERLYKVGGFQMVTDAGLSYTTDKESRAQLNDLGGWSVGQTAIYSTDAGWDIGAAVSVGGTIYGDNDADENRAAYGLGIYPFAEYAFSESVQFRTVFGYFNYAATRAAPGTLITEDPYQSMGIGFVITRDIYLYPNVQFVPTDIRADRTNVALSANISL